MISADRVAAILLAAGASARFGDRDKLAEALDGLPLGLHAARTFSRFPFLAKVVVTRPGGPDFGAFGWELAMNHDSRAGQALSIRIGLAKVCEFEPEAVLIMLADMPFVTGRHVEALLAGMDSRRPIVASTDGRRRSPPAVFQKPLFPMLERLSGDMGARMLLKDAYLIQASAAELKDIDTPRDIDGLSKT